MTADPQIVYDEVNERQSVFHRRTFLLGGIAGVGVLALAGRLAQLQIVEAQRYSTLSASNQFNFRLRTPPRGRIVDRDGVAIASSRPDFRLLMRRDEVKDVPAALANLAQLIPISEARQAQLARQIKDSPRGAPVAVANDLTWDEFSRISVRAPELPGVIPDVGEARVYPMGGAFSHVIGYVSRVTEKDIDNADDPNDRLLLDPGFRIGKQGVEKALDTQLRGKPGFQKVEVDSVGRVIRYDPAGDIPATPGAEVQLTLDADIQQRALELFGAEAGAAVLMDCRTGDVLCMVSAPAFDPNAFVAGAPAPYYRQLASYDHKPLLDKALSATFPPGSTFKTLVAMACLENGYDPKTVHVCGKSFTMGGHIWHCDRAHGPLNMSQAIAASCDVYFYQAILTAGPDRVADLAKRFGIMELFDVGITGQHKGLVGDQAWKRKALAKSDPKWHPGDTVSMGIGQGYVNANPLQLCVQCARIANGDKAVTPRIVHSVGGREQPRTPFEDLGVDPAHTAFVRAAMKDVIYSPIGTLGETHSGDMGLGPNITWAGKSGTAQSHNYAGGIGQHGAVGNWSTRDHAWFIAFAPADAPRYAVSVLVEHGGWGASSSGPRARELLKLAIIKDPELRAQIEAPIPSEAQIATPPPPNVGPAKDPTLPVPVPADPAAVAAAASQTT